MTLGLYFNIINNNNKKEEQVVSILSCGTVLDSDGSKVSKSNVDSIKNNTKNDLTEELDIPIKTEEPEEST